MRTSNPVLNPAGDWDPVYPGSWRRCGWCNCLCTPPTPVKPSRGEALPTHPPRSWRAERRPLEGAPPARPAPQQVQPRALPVVSTQTCLPATGVDPARSLRRGLGWGTPETGLTPQSWPAGAPAFPGAEPAAPQCPEPRRPHAPGARGDHTNAPRPTPLSSPGLRTSALSSGGDGGRRPEPRARSGAGGGRGAGERAPGLHMLTRAARGQRPASAGS